MLRWHLLSRIELILVRLNLCPEILPRYPPEHWRDLHMEAGKHGTPSPSELGVTEAGSSLILKLWQSGASWPQVSCRGPSISHI
jgi:hypothetical protein